MRARFVATAVVAGVSLAACGIDLFHSTDFDTLCVADPRADACAQADATAEGGTADGPSTDGNGSDGNGNTDDAADGGGGDTGPPPKDSGRDAAPTNFCGWTSAMAHDKARRACAWLGACASGFGANDFGQCFDDAVRAYDCTISPMRKVTGKVHDYWDCLWQATTCADVTACVMRGVAPACAPGGSEVSACSASGDVGFDCPAVGGTPTSLEACVGAGKVCDTTTGALVCAGSTGGCAASPPAACSGTRIFDCSAMIDQGVDCALFGGVCVKPVGVGPACTPAVDAGACVPTTTLTCLVGGVVSGCPAGTTETVDCSNLLETSGGCNATNPGRPWDVSRGCKASGVCTPKCNPDGSLAACHRGLHLIDVPCTLYGLHACVQGTHLTATTFQCSP